jgi:hypothetical protein
MFLDKRMCVGDDDSQVMIVIGNRRLKSAIFLNFS